MAEANSIGGSTEQTEALALDTPQPAERIHHSTSGGLALWVPALAFSAGLALVPFSFWGGIILMTVSLPVLWVLFFHSYGKTERGKRAAVIIGSIILYIVTIWIIWTPTSISVHLIYDNTDFAPGTNIYSIKSHTS
jgi:hypothetical protein